MLTGAQTETPAVRMPGTDRLVCDEPRVCEAFRQAFEINGVVQTEETGYDKDSRLEIERKVALYTSEAGRADTRHAHHRSGEVEVSLSATNVCYSSTDIWFVAQLLCI